MKSRSDEFMKWCRLIPMDVRYEFRLIVLGDVPAGMHPPTVRSARSATRTARIGPSGGVIVPKRLISALLKGRSQANAFPATNHVRLPWRSQPGEGEPPGLAEQLTDQIQSLRSNRVILQVNLTTRPRGLLGVRILAVLTSWRVAAEWNTGSNDESALLALLGGECATQS